MHKARAGWVLGVLLFIWLISALVGQTNYRSSAPERAPGPQKRDASGQRRAYTAEQLSAAQTIVQAMEKEGVVRDWSRPATIIVDPSFFLFDFEQKQIACRALDIVRQSSGLQAGFIIRESMNNRQVGNYVMGHLSMNR